MYESNLIFGIGIWDMSLRVKGVVLWTEVGNKELVVLIVSLILEGIAVEQGGWRSRLLEDPLHDGVLGSSSSVLGLLSVPSRSQKRVRLKFNDDLIEIEIFTYSII